LAFDGGVARVFGALSDQAWAAGRHPGFADLAIAATAIAHDLVLLTQNVRHFESLGVPLADPMGALPAHR
jgi:predicted nucleic acid-binding protein